MAETKQAPAEPANAPATNHAHPITVEVRVRLQALALPEADGRYSVLIPALPGCCTQGDTIEEVQFNAVEAAEAWLEVAHDYAKVESLRVARGE